MVNMIQNAKTQSKPDFFGWFPNGNFTTKSTKNTLNKSVFLLRALRGENYSGGQSVATLNFET